MLKFIYPPRPRGAVPPSQLPSFEDGTWLVQHKFDGHRCILGLVCISEHLWLCPEYNDKFRQRFDATLQMPDVHGLVLRRKDSRLDHSGKKYYEVDWQVRCRHPGKTYRF